MKSCQDKNISLLIQFEKKRGMKQDLMHVIYCAMLTHSASCFKSIGGSKAALAYLYQEIFSFAFRIDADAKNIIDAKTMSACVTFRVSSKLNEDLS